MWATVKKIWHAKDLREKIIFVFLMLVLFRITAHIPIPGVNSEAVSQLFAQNQLLGFVNIFSGGALENFSIVMLGVGPYITASIIFQILQIVVPKLEQMAKEEGEAGQKKINQYTRLATIPLAAIQGYATMNLLQSASGGGILSSSMTVLDWALAITVVTAGSVFLMWIGELITEKQIGNGLSLIIFAGIIASLPSTIQTVFLSFDSSQIPTLLGFAAIGFATIVGVVYVTEGQRNIPISYARHHSAQGQKSHLPIRINQAGVIPIIFAIALVLSPSLIAQITVQSGVPWVVTASQWTIAAFNNQLFYGVTYFSLVVIFSYFYTGVVFHPDRIAENLQRSGSFIPGIRPGVDTEEYIRKVSNRILLPGSLFLGAIAVLPVILQAFASGGLQNIAIGGTSLLIVVSVAIETVKQIEAQLLLRDYEKF